MHVSSMLDHTRGKRTIGRQPLVAATHAADLNRVNPERFMARLDEA